MTAAVTPAASAPAAPVIRTRAWVEQVMGLPVSVHVRALDPDRADIAAAVADVWSLLREVDAVFSTWRHDSDVMQIRRGVLTAQWAHPWIGDIQAMCAYAEAATGGLFTTDLTGPDGSRGWDPTGLVKGWAVDLAARRLRTLSGATFCINAGGDVVCGRGRASHEVETPWRVGIQDPHDRAGVLGVLEITDGAVATSGVAARGNHIIDPRTGRPARSTIQTTVRGPLLVWADVWATACFIDPAAAPPADYELVSAVTR